MTRPDANRIALRAVSAILRAAGPQRLVVGGQSISVQVAGRRTEPWPGYRLDGITAAVHGPWPEAVVLSCDWPGGSCKLELRASVFRPREHGSYQVSLEIAAPESNRSLVWLTIAMQIREAEDGDEAQVYANPSLSTRNKEYEHIRERINLAIRELVDAGHLPMLSPGRLDAFRVRIPGGDVLPSAARACDVLLHLALIKLPFLDRGGRRAIRGRAYIDVDATINKARADLERQGAPVSSGKHVNIPRLPGSYRDYKTSLDRMLGFVAHRPVSATEFDRLLEDELEVNKRAAQGSRRLLLRLGLLRDSDERIELSAEGRAYVNNPDAANLFSLLHGSFEGMLATLAISARTGGADSTTTPWLLALLCDLPDDSINQAERRRNWLVSLGLAERVGGRDEITAAGRVILEQYADEVDELYARIDSILAAPAEAGGESEAHEGEGSDSSESQATLTPEEKERKEPPLWLDDRLDLRPASVEEHVKKLWLPPGLVDQLCAALSVGKHLLLVGPPGTGKTELAHALARAAAEQGYCAGLYASTASADWTTYETIGGYAMERDGKLNFRPGAFLRAVELWQWLLIDELNRADVDKAFGELMTVLSGKSTDTPYELSDGRHVSMGPDEHHTHRVPRTFRVLATMNTWDKTSLFRLSFAVQRRFAIVHVGLPAPAQYRGLLEDAATREGVEAPLPAAALASIQALFDGTGEGLLAHRQIGPAVALDMVQYLRRRQGHGDSLAEAIAMFLLPQLEGLDAGAADAVWTAIAGVLEDGTSQAGLAEVRTRYRELFPYARLRS